jgi:hypothetical protein
MIPVWLFTILQESCNDNERGRSELFKRLNWHNFMIFLMRERRKLIMTQVSDLGNWVDTCSPSLIWIVVLT